MTEEQRMSRASVSLSLRRACSSRHHDSHDESAAASFRSIHRSHEWRSFFILLWSNASGLNQKGPNSHAIISAHIDHVVRQY